MKIDLKKLPADTSFLMSLVGDLSTENESLQSQNISLLIQNDSLKSTIEILKAQLALLKAKQFGQSSEKLNKQIDVLEGLIEENEVHAQCPLDPDPKEDETVDEVSDSKTPSKGQAKRKKCPEHLPRVDTILSPDPVCPSCGGDKFRTIGDDISEMLEYSPASFKVLRTIRPRCACIHCDQIVQAVLPSKTIDKGKAGPGLLAHIMIQKYADHLPLYRQSQIFEREGIYISRSTMAGWVRQCSTLLEPIIDGIKSYVFAGTHIHGDDTTVKVLSPGLGKTKTGRIWTYVRDGRAHGDKSPLAACYFYSPDRKGERPREHLKDYEGVFHADAFAGYNGVYRSDNNPDASILEAACWAHTRRKFYEVTVANDKASIAISILQDIGEIYKVEETINGLTPEERRTIRQEKSKPLVSKLFDTMKKHYSKLSVKSGTAQAIAYATNNRIALERFLDDGRIDIDNNIAERAMRSIAVGRKNWMFAGSDLGGIAAANFYTITETLKLNHINPWAYLHKVFDTIQDHPQSKIDELLPWNIKLE